MYKKINDKLKNKLTEYLEFDVSLLFTDDKDYSYIFGGSIRDIIANVEINDIDILCLGDSYRNIVKLLQQNNYSNYNKLTSKDIMTLYSDIHIIFEPDTFIKTSKDKIKIVQLIRSSSYKYLDKKNNVLEILHDVCFNVDINICGVRYNTNFGIIEDVEDAIFYIKNKVFLVNDNAKMYHKTRIYNRVHKLEKKGYKCLSTKYGTYDDLFDDKKDFINFFNVKLERYKKFKYFQNH